MLSILCTDQSLVLVSLNLPCLCKCRRPCLALLWWANCKTYQRFRLLPYSTSLWPKMEFTFGNPTVPWVPLGLGSWHVFLLSLCVFRPLQSSQYPIPSPLAWSLLVQPLWRECHCSWWTQSKKYAPLCQHKHDQLFALPLWDAGCRVVMFGKYQLLVAVSFLCPWMKTELCLICSFLLLRILQWINMSVIPARACHCRLLADACHWFTSNSRWKGWLKFLFSVPDFTFAPCTIKSSTCSLLFSSVTLLLRFVGKHIQYGLTHTAICPANSVIWCPWWLMCSWVFPQCFTYQAVVYLSTLSKESLRGQIVLL